MHERRAPFLKEETLEGAWSGAYVSKVSFCCAFLNLEKLAFLVCIHRGTVWKMPPPHFGLELVCLSYRPPVNKHYCRVAEVGMVGVNIFGTQDEARTQYLLVSSSPRKPPGMWS